ncbi:hypothetical protein N665_0022s0033 [Sinapis alba]|nr:hypothetical protein N665_0022s0033 [Sinapis alba]
MQEAGPYLCRLMPSISISVRLKLFACSLILQTPLITKDIPSRSKDYVEVKIAKTQWTKKKRKKPLKDITSPLKEVPEVEVEIPKSVEKENEIEANPDEDEENKNEDNPIEDEENENEENSDEDEESENKDNHVEDEENENDNGKKPNPVENEVEENEDNVVEEEEETNCESNSPGEDVQTNKGDREEGSTSQTLSKHSVEEAIKPLAMYFPPSEYRKKIKILTRCFISEVIKTLKELDLPMSTLEKSWFENHPQFKHIFHMPQAGNHKRTCFDIWIELLKLPLNYKVSGGTNFVRKYFGAGIIRYQDVKAKVHEGMEPSHDRLRLLVLYFLSSILVGQRKTGDDAPPAEPFLLGAVDDLNLCKTFPWGRLSFDYMLKQISNTMSHFDGEVKEGVIWSVLGFCIPVEHLRQLRNWGPKFERPLKT